MCIVDIIFYINLWRVTWRLAESRNIFIFWLTFYILYRIAHICMGAIRPRILSSLLRSGRRVLFLIWCFYGVWLRKQIANIMLEQAHSHFMMTQYSVVSIGSHDDVIKWKHLCAIGFSPHEGQWRTAKMFSLICTWTNVSANNRDAYDLRLHRAHYDVVLMRK